MEFNMYYNANPIYGGSYPSTSYPPEHNVFIANYFLGNTTVEGPHCPTYPTAPPFHFYTQTDKPTDSDPNPYHHTTDKHTESLHRPAYKEPTSYSSDQVKPASKPEVKPELNYETDKPPVQEYPPLAYPQEFREGAFSFNVWQNVKEEDETDSDQFPVTLPGCVYNADSCRQHAQSMPSSENMSTERGPFSAAQPAYEDQMRGGQYYGESKSHVIPDSPHASQNQMTEDHLISTGEEFTSQQFQTVNHYTGDPAQEDKLVKIIQEAKAEKDHKRVMELIATNYFSSHYHETLQNLWLSAVYGFAKVRRGKAPNAVDRYRLRKKYPFPATVWNGERKLYTYKESARNLLEDFYTSNKYPTPDQKRDLSESCDLTYMQVCNWFKNKRMRGKADAQSLRSHSGNSTPERGPSQTFTFSDTG